MLWVFSVIRPAASVLIHFNVYLCGTDNSIVWSNVQWKLSISCLRSSYMQVYSNICSAHVCIRYVRYFCATFGSRKLDHLLTMMNSSRYHTTTSTPVDVLTRTCIGNMQLLLSARRLISESSIDWLIRRTTASVSGVKMDVWRKKWKWK